MKFIKKIDTESRMTLFSGGFMLLAIWVAISDSGTPKWVWEAADLIQMSVWLCGSLIVREIHSKKLNELQKNADDIRDKLEDIAQRVRC